MALDPTTGPAAPEGSRRMDLTTVLLLLTSIALATAGQLLLKAGMNEIGGGGLDLGDLGQLLRTGATTWQVIVGLAAFGTSAVFWLLTLSRVPLSTAYPIVSLSYLLILAFSVLVLDERPDATVWTGAALIMTGISLIGIGQR
jgi:undecaprenyl phosphate-alpha-L-ara4N flippase subunit ArnF